MCCGKWVDKTLYLPVFTVNCQLQCVPFVYLSEVKELKMEHENSLANCWCWTSTFKLDGIMLVLQICIIISFVFVNCFGIPLTLCLTINRILRDCATWTTRKSWRQHRQGSMQNLLTIVPRLALGSLRFVNSSDCDISPLCIILSICLVYMHVLYNDVWTAFVAYLFLFAQNSLPKRISAWICSGWFGDGRSFLSFSNSVYAFLPWSNLWETPNWS